MAPLWVRASAAAIRRLPFGRYRAAHVVGKVRVAPFLMRLPARAGSQVFLCDLRDSISREVCFTGLYEPQETRLFDALLRPGMRVVDAGAHWGYFTLLCANRVGASGRVLSLEPDERLVDLLRANVEANGLTQVTCIRAAAASARGTAAFAAFRESDGNWGLSRIAPAGLAADFEVETVSLDELVAGERGGVVDVVKIDVEGAEADVIRGMRDGLKAHRYTHLLLECHPAHLAERMASVDDCFEPLRAAGYQGWLIDHSPAMHRRAAVEPVPIRELLQPLTTARVVSDRWPHTWWCAPGVSPF
jgi:FkbM family methyltransferase